MNTNMTEFGWFSSLCVLVLWIKVALALEGLILLFKNCVNSSGMTSRSSSLIVVPVLKARWSKALPLPACCLSPLRVCPDGRVV